VRQAIAYQVLDADTIEEIVARTLKAQSTSNPSDETERFKRELHDVDGEIVRYVGAIDQGGDMPETRNSPTPKPNR
jgi:hypothetical protein